MTSREEHLNKSQFLITRNKLNLLRAQNDFYILDANFVLCWPQHASPVEPEPGTAHPELGTALLSQRVQTDFTEVGTL